MTDTATVPRRRLTTGGVEVPPLCLGGNVFGWNLDEAASFAVLDAYVDGGGTFIDTADAYSTWVDGNVGGESETIIGNWLAARPGMRERVVIATKVSMTMPYGSGLGRAHIRRAVEESLRRLRTNTIDLYYAHRDDAATPLEETLGAFDELVREGKVRALGASNFGEQRLAEALEVSSREGLARYEVLQPMYNLLDRAEFEGGLQELCAREGVVVAPYYSLAVGFLTGKYRRDEPVPDSVRAGNAMARYGNDRGWAVVDAVREVADRRGATMAQVVLAWLAAQPTIVAPIASATSVEQVRDLLGVLRFELSAEDLQLLP